MQKLTDINFSAETNGICMGTVFLSVQKYLKQQHDSGMRERLLSLLLKMVL